MRALLLFPLLFAVLPGCDAAEEAPALPTKPIVRPEAPDAGPPAQPPPPTRWTVRVSAEAPPPVRWAASDVARYLGELGLDVRERTAAGPVACAAGEGVVALVGDGLGQAVFPPDTAVTDQTWRVQEVACAGGRVVLLGGGGLLGRQYAAYAWLHHLGVRFFHPEQTYVPPAPAWSDPPWDRTHTPAFERRSVSLHLTHPLELGDPLRAGRLEYLEEVRRYIDWGVRNFASDGLAGLDGTPLQDYGPHRGFPLSSGFSLYNQQQGASGLLDPDDPRSDEVQLAEAIDARMGDPERRPDVFSFTFNPSEFTEEDDRTVVRQLTFIADYFRDKYPETKLFATNHGTAGPPTPHYGVRYYDLPQFAPENLGVKVHTLMFYDLERPAPVYGNADFHFLYDFMEREHTKREIEYFPEAAWWLTFDIAVPLYLPITIEARSRDLGLIAHMLEGKLTGHRVFGTGHEWGYWQNEYCSYRMAADLAYDWHACLADLTSPMGPAAAEVQAVLEAQVALQVPLFTRAELLAYLVGTDPETEAAAAVGVVFHPLPPAPADIARWDLARISAWRQEILAPLRTSLDAHYALVGRLEDAAAQVPERGRPWFAEVADGVEANTLRLAHQIAAYDALVSRREARLTGDAALQARAEALLDAALATTELVQGVIARREAGYRYRPLARATGGGPTLDQDENWTIYPYRYLGRTHQAYYYRRIDELAVEAFAGTEADVEVATAVLGPGEPLVLRLAAPGLPGLAIDAGDGVALPPASEVEHVYAEPGLYTVRVTAPSGLDVALDVAALADAARAGPDAVVEDPPQVQIIAGLLPAVVVGTVDAERVVIGFAPAADVGVAVGDWAALPRDAAAEVPTSAPARLAVPLFNRGDGRVLARITVEDAVVSAPGPVRVAGALAIDDVIDALVGVGGFEPDGARRLVASLLGYTPDTLPERVDFAVRFEPPAE
ncbi:MAG: PKD domain-containing protein [Myxococcales bacterium]|nr:PKD domain-containing protein [Myxococcales bacterium]